MKITITDDQDKVLFTKESDELSVGQIAAVAQTREERRIKGTAQVAAILARRTPEQVTEAERVAALTPEQRVAERTKIRKAQLEAELAKLVAATE